MHKMDASLSARRAWIEIPVTAYCAYLPMVALRKESVDRNIMVDDPDLALPAVALRKESVDRNQCAYEMSSQEIWSLSARRAWIEIRYAL